MALATQCPHCGKRFRVAADQLKLYGGIVRCGACQEIFDGNASLVDLDAPAAAPAGHSAAPQEIDAGPADAAQGGIAVLESGVVPADEPAPPQEIHAEPAEAAEGAIAAPEACAVPAEDAASAQEIDAEPAEAEPAEAVPASLDAPDQDFDASQDSDAIPVYTLDFDHTFDPLGILPKPAQDEPAAEDMPVDDEPIETALIQPELELLQPEPEPAAQSAASLAGEPAHHEPAAPVLRDEPTLEFAVDEELVAAPLPGDDADDLALHDSGARAATAGAGGAPLPMREAAGTDFTSAAATRPARPRVADARPGRRSKLTPTKISAPKLRVPEIDEPEFVRRSRQQEQSGKTMRIALAAGSLLLLLALAAQLAMSFRHVLAARYPAAKPALLAACKLFGCRVELPAQIENLVIETGELTTLGGGSTYALTTLLRNQGSLVQAWPRIELALTDANDKPLLRRVFTPVEYLPQGATPATGFGARAEQPVKLYFQLDQLKPSGYHIAVFYP